MDVRVSVLDDVDEASAAAIARLLPHVSSHASSVSADRIKRVAAGPASCVVVARADGEIVGMATLVILVTLVGQFGYVEEVAVDDSMRGQGLGKQLMNGLLEVAHERNLDFVELTSRPSREAANGKYRSVGFTLRETNVYRYHLR
jgi:ribosomal protein S18 acetylase RimI-like enzyme